MRFHEAIFCICLIVFFVFALSFAADADMEEAIRAEKQYCLGVDVWNGKKPEGWETVAPHPDYKGIYKKVCK